MNAFNVEDELYGEMPDLSKRSDKERRIVSVAKSAAEIGTRETARRFGIAPDTVTAYLRIALGAIPRKLKLEFISPPGRRRFIAKASGEVWQQRGRKPRMVRFRVTIEALTFEDALKGIFTAAAQAANAKARL